MLKAQGIKNGKYVAIKCMKNHFDRCVQRLLAFLHGDATSTSHSHMYMHMHMSMSMYVHVHAHVHVHAQHSTRT